MERSGSGDRRWRAVALVALGAVVGTMLVATPGVAHVGGSVTHLVGHLKAYFYTKSEAKKQFLPAKGTLPPGKTLRGVYWALDDDEVSGQSIAAGVISFPVPLTTAPVSHYIPEGSPVPAGCSGTPQNPVASPGHLCVFQESGYNTSSIIISAPDDGASSSRHGAIVLAFSAGTGRFSNAGRWAVTAPLPSATPRAPARESGGNLSRGG
jgi:hypothetical protein